MALKFTKISEKFPVENEVVLAKSSHSELGYSVLKLHYQQGEPAFWFSESLGVVVLGDVTDWVSLSEVLGV